MKFSSEESDPVNGSDFIFRAFGANTTRAIRRHKMFKAFFTSVNPMDTPPDRSKAPNHKIQPLLNHIIQISKEAVYLGRSISIDEQTVGFTGNHEDKQRIKYKREGDGFLADCICSDGYTYIFYFRHQPPSEKIMKTWNCSALHARVLALLSQLPEKNYWLTMDNLFNSCKLSKLAMAMPQKVMTHGVVRSEGRGVPKVVKQLEVTNKDALKDARFTVKAAKLVGDEVCRDLLCVSFYDTKPVYFLSTVMSKIEWVKKFKMVFDKFLNKKVPMPYYRLNLIDFYNQNMGHVDVADQLRNCYRYDSNWHRNRKWWWAVWWWGFQILLTNSYVAYSKYYDLVEMSEKKMSHYDYIKAVALSWICPNRFRSPSTSTTSTSDSAVYDLEVFLPAKKKVKLSSSETYCSTTSSSSTTILKRKTVVNDSSLHPSHGELICRLNTTVQHFPENKKSKHQKHTRPKCQLHRWARGRKGLEVRSNILSCDICNVNLCVDCFALFHKEANLVALKSKIAES